MKGFAQVQTARLWQSRTVTYKEPAHTHTTLFPALPKNSKSVLEISEPRMGLTPAARYRERHISHR